jgi:hypothetical protein
MTFSTTVLNNMGIEREPQLDIDNPNAVDAYPVFFQPLAHTPYLSHAFMEAACQEGRTPDWGHCPYEVGHSGDTTCASLLSSRLSGLHFSAGCLFDLQPPDVPEWHIERYVFFDTRFPPHVPKTLDSIYLLTDISFERKLPEYSAVALHLRNRWYHRSDPRTEWRACRAFYLEAKGMHHIGCHVLDNTPHRKKPDEALHSEITAGISFIRRHIRDSHDIHSTIPV